MTDVPIDYEVGDHVLIAWHQTVFYDAKILAKAPDETFKVNAGGMIIPNLHISEIRRKLNTTEWQDESVRNLRRAAHRGINALGLSRLT